ncbi:MAG: glutathione S-transferase N-terminal domain-containing protein [Hyphomicrobiaceae bacterium]|nr:glutathione S-transferase N-terminal domain-containing protein [Hyphomicrobiaceae bacterium]
MKLFTSPTTPFGRKVLLAAAIKRVDDQIETVNADTNPPGNAELMKFNPLGKIPVLVLDDGTPLFDSAVICQYIDTLGEPDAPRLIPEHGPDRWATLRLAALADGIAEAGILIFYESRFRTAEHHNADWISRQQQKVDAGLDYFDQHPLGWDVQPDYAHLSLAAALGHLDLRHGRRWRTDRPRLVNWLDHFGNAVPAYAKTTPVG